MFRHSEDNLPIRWGIREPLEGAIRPDPVRLAHDCRLENAELMHAIDSKHT
jgi:hypothetical protein